MADEELLESMDELGEEEEGEGGGSPLLKYLPLIGGVLVVQVIIGYVLVTLLFSPSEEGEEMVEEDVPVEVTKEAMVGQPPLPRVTEVFQQLDIIVVNPAGTEGLRFLSAKVDFGISGSEVSLFIENNNLIPKINDTLVGILSSKTIPQLDPINHPTLKEEIRERLNEFLGENAIVEIYFPSFVLQ